MSRLPLLPLLALLPCAFSVATSELMLVGLLPQLAVSLDVSIPDAGLLVTGYALGVVISAPVVAIITAGMARRAMILGLMAVFIAGNLVCALAPNYAILMAARVLTSVSHATLFGSAAVIAADISPEDKRATAVALVFSGASIATIAGVPLGTAVGDAFGWRAAFVMVACMGTLSMVAVLFWLPAKLPVHRADFRHEIRGLLNRQAIFALAVTGLAWACLFAVLTFIAPFLEDSFGASEDVVVVFLFMLGVGMTIGGLVGGRLADWRLMPTVIGLIAAAAVMLTITSIVMAHPYLMIVTLLFWGAFLAALGPAVQIWVVRAASGSPHLLSTLNQGSFHLGSAAGAWIAASALYFGISYRHLPWVAEGLIVAALIVSVLAVSGEFLHRHRLFARSSSGP